ncbi:hypothetical protein JCM11251_001443 [Rhodosporidiobolus azoricus]
MRPSPLLRLKLLALPLTRTPASSTQPSFYLHALRSSLSSPQAKQRQQDSEPAYLGYANKAIDKAADLWAGLGKAEGGWKKKTYDTGERMMDKIEYEEWALKAIDPALAPKPWGKNAASSSSSASSSPSPSSAAAADEKVEILYPSSVLSRSALLSQLKDQLEHRAPHHRSAAIRCLAFSPLTWPFAIIPIVPNLPLFYVLWRAWSHYRAHKASDYLLHLFSPSSSASSSDKTPYFSTEASSELDDIYSSTSSSPSTSSDVLLSNDQIARITDLFSLTLEEQKELERAVLQTEQRAEQQQAIASRAAEEGEQGKLEEVAKAEAEVVKEGVKEEVEKTKKEGSQ